MVTTETSGNPVFMGGDSSGFGANSNWIWAFLIFALLGGGGFANAFGGNGNSLANYTASGLATKDDLSNQFNFSALERQNNETVSAIKDAQAGTVTAIKDTAYNNLSELRDLQTAVSDGFTVMQTDNCAIQRGIDSVNYNGAINTASINANTTSQTQKILDAISASKIEDLQSQISSLQLQNAMNGVVRYPNAWTYSAGASPFCNGGCCNSAYY